MIPLLEDGSEQDLIKVTQDLYKIYFKLLSDAINNEDIYFVKLEDIDQFALKLGESIGVMPDFSKSWKRESTNKSLFTIGNDEEMFKKYQQVIEEIPRIRLFSL
jgi:hypothetical protein